MTFGTILRKEVLDLTRTVQANLADGGFRRLFSRFRRTHELRAGNLVGTDSLGNRYYEDLDAHPGRDRWVEFAARGPAEATRVPPLWHGWLHKTVDLVPPSPGHEERGWLVWGGFFFSFLFFTFFFSFFFSFFFFFFSLLL
jgi:NADH:ubiquinone oxidoreductase subunit